MKNNTLQSCSLLAAAKRLQLARVCKPLNQTLLTLAAGFWLTCGGFAADVPTPAPVAVARAPMDIFLDPPSSVATETTGAPGKAQRSRPTRINFASAAAAHAGQALRFQLFEDVDWAGQVESVEERSPSSYTLAGKLANAPESSFAISVEDDVLVGNFRNGHGQFYQVRYWGNGLHVIRSVDESQFPPCATGPEHLVATSDSAANDSRSTSAVAAEPDTGTTIDVMVVYTPAARTAVGGTTAMNALINLAVDESNVAYRESRINPRLRLVHRAEVSYTESADFSTDLNRLTSPTDGFMDNVQSLRNTYGADMVSLWINNSASCGIGWLMTSLSSSFESRAFSVVHHDCATGYYSFAHELGHNMGCHHDRANANSVPLYPYAYGWRFIGNSGAEWRTIMAYAPGTRIQRFSNPDVLYDGQPTGRPVGYADQANNALCINNVAYTVANFRQAVCVYALGASSASFPASGGNGSVALNTASGCAWAAASDVSWITITGGNNGAGPATITYSVAANTSTSSRTGTLLIGNNVFTVTQAAGGGCVVTPIAMSTTLSGMLSTTDCASNQRGPGYYADRYSFSGTAGQQVVISLSSTAFDTYLYLVTPTGAVLSDDDGGGGTNSRLPAGTGVLTLPATGNYTIEVTSYSGGVTGAYALSLMPASTCAYTLSATSATFAKTGGTGSVAVATSGGCTWSATSNSSWITITSGNSGNGNGVVTYQVAANTKKQNRTGTLTIAGRTFTVTQSGK